MLQSQHIIFRVIIANEKSIRFFKKRDNARRISYSRGGVAFHHAAERGAAVRDRLADARHSLDDALRA